MVQDVACFPNDPANLNSFDGCLSGFNFFAASQYLNLGGGILGLGPVATGSAPSLAQALKANSTISESSVSIYLSNYFNSTTGSSQMSFGGTPSSWLMKGTNSAEHQLAKDAQSSWWQLALHETLVYDQLLQGSSAKYVIPDPS